MTTTGMLATPRRTAAPATSNGASHSVHCRLWRASPDHSPSRPLSVICRSLLSGLVLRSCSPTQTCFRVAITSHLLRPQTDTPRRQRRTFGVGQLVNHPPAGVLPNVRAVGLDLHPVQQHCVGSAEGHGPAGAPDAQQHWRQQSQLLRWFRTVNVNFRPPAAGDFALRTAVLAATRDIEAGEELWLDYRIGQLAEAATEAATEQARGDATTSSSSATGGAQRWQDHYCQSAVAAAGPWYTPVRY